MSSKHSAAFTGGSGKPRLIVQIRDAIRVRHYSYRTEQAYVAWIRRFILFHGKRHPIQMGGDEVRGFLSWLASERDVAAATQAQALAAILFLYKHVLDVDLPWVENVVRARRPKRLPVVLTRGEVRQALRELQGDYWLLASLLYGSGLRLMEGLRLRVKDLDLQRRELVVRGGKSDKDRVSVIPLTLVAPLRAQLERVRLQHEEALVRGYAGVELPHALDRKYPRAHLEFGWQHFFPMARPSRAHLQAGLLSHLPPQLRDALAGIRRRHPHGAGIVRSLECQDHPDLHARAEPRRIGGAESAGCLRGHAAAGGIQAVTGGERCHDSRHRAACRLK